jgi:hypothetical protein
MKTRTWRGRTSAGYGMRGIVAWRNPKLTAAMRQKQREREKDDSGIRPHHVHPRLTFPDGRRLEGVSRLVNPAPDDPQIVAADEDRVERNYLGRLLQVADEALHVKPSGEQRKRRGRPH